MNNDLSYRRGGADDASRLRAHIRIKRAIRIVKVAGLSVGLLMASVVFIEYRGYVREKTAHEWLKDPACRKGDPIRRFEVIDGPMKGVICDDPDALRYLDKEADKSTSHLLNNHGRYFEVRLDLASGKRIECSSIFRDDGVSLFLGDDAWFETTILYLPLSSDIPPKLLELKELLSNDVDYGIRHF